MPPTLRRLTAATPARANLIGNPSDQYGGVTVACSVPLYARASAQGAEEAAVVVEGRELRLESPEDLCPGDDEFELARAALRFVSPPDAVLPVRLELTSEIPRQSGIAGSTALLVSLLNALLHWQGRAPGPYELAEMARAVERDGLGIQCGFVDQYQCVFGGLRYVDFRGKAHDLEGGAGPLATVEDLAPHAPELSFVLGFTGEAHSSDAVHRPIRERWLDGEPEVIAAYERVAELGMLGKKALLLGDVETLGVLMDENHEIQRALGGSGPANEKLIDAALDAGAAGAKLAGAGGGGTIVALWPDGDPAPLETALMEAGARATFRPEIVPGTVVREEEVRS